MLQTGFNAGSKPLLDWDTRLNIAVGAARGLSYLHNDTDPRIIHRDIKSANILLDAKMQAQVRGGMLSLKCAQAAKSFYRWKLN